MCPDITNLSARVVVAIDAEISNHVATLVTRISNADAKEMEACRLTIQREMRHTTSKKEQTVKFGQGDKDRYIALLYHVLYG